MKYRFNIICSFLFFGLISANFLAAEINFNVSTGYRRDQLDWSFAFHPPATPNIFSEITWSNLEIWQISTRLSVVSVYNLYLRGNADYGWIYNGKSQESCFYENDRQAEDFRLNFCSDQGNVYDATLGVGRACYFFGKSILLAPIIGYSVHGHNLHMTNGIQTRAYFPEHLGSLGDLHNTCKTLWNGPWAGLDAFYQFSPYLTFWGTAEYHRAKYHAKLFLNALYESDSLHDAWGNGAVFSGGFQYMFYPGWCCGLMGNYQYWRTGPGRDRSFYISYEKGRLFDDLRLNPVTWSSWSLALELCMNW